MSEEIKYRFGEGTFYIDSDLYRLDSIKGIFKNNYVERNNEHSYSLGVTAVENGHGYKFKTKEARDKAFKDLTDAIEIHEKMKLLDGFAIAFAGKQNCNEYEAYKVAIDFLEARQAAKEQLEKGEVKPW